MNSSEKMFIVGLNHLNASIASREKAVVSSQDLPDVLGQLKNLGILEEAVVLSTCSRVEVYAACGDPGRGRDRVRAWFVGRAGAGIEASLYEHEGGDALRHLFRVSSGLDSWIIGETEISAQIKQAYQAALARGFTRRILNRAFQAALSAGKSVRSATGIQNGIHSIGGAAALMARRIFGDQAGGEIVVFGAGPAAEAVVRHLAAKKFNRIIVANRTLENALVLAGRLGGAAATLEEGLARLEQAEVAVFSTSASGPLLRADALARVLARRRKPLFLIDLGLPRNVDPACAKIDAAYLYDLDDLRLMIRDSMAGKLEEKSRAEELAALAALACRQEMDKTAGGGVIMRAHRGRRTLGAGLALAALCALTLAPAHAAEPAVSTTTAPTPAPAAGAAKVGRAVCATCHADKDESFGKTFHGRKSLSQSKLADSCESCHGPGGLHSESGDPALIRNPKKLEAGAAADLCLSCHTNKAVMMWKTSHHAQNGLSCVQCHSVHEGEGRASLKANAVFEEKIQTETCLKCHKKQKADMRLASHHPVPEGKMACVSCHNPHGGIDGNLKADSSEELCAKCHVEKVGPFANEHPPVADSCTNCHLPHGSANDKLLKQAPPYLCLNCHKFPHTTTQNGFTGVALSREEQRGSCMDCHKEIHGSDRKARLKD